MSIIIIDNNNKILLFCKGADDVIFPRLAHNAEFKDETMKNM
jgi:magnesium-transporting ATPase (P-type)